MTPVLVTAMSSRRQSYQDPASSHLTVDGNKTLCGLIVTGAYPRKLLEPRCLKCRWHPINVASMSGVVVS